RSSRRRPRKICLRKDGAFHSASRASSATRRASVALTGPAFVSAIELLTLHQDFAVGREAVIPSAARDPVLESPALHESGIPRRPVPRVDASGGRGRHL